jgi:hypothetical protein
MGRKHWPADESFPRGAGHPGTGAAMRVPGRMGVSVDSTHSARCGLIGGQFRRRAGQDRRAVRLSRHARNELRFFRVASDDVKSTIRDPATRELDDRGNARLAGETADGRPVVNPSLAELLTTTALRM